MTNPWFGAIYSTFALFARRERDYILDVSSVNKLGTDLQGRTMAAPMSSLAAARHMCERSDWTLTNLELQKMLYLAQMFYMGQHGGERLMNGSFEAWDYGPVLPTVYGQVKGFGSGPIRNAFFGVSTIRDGSRAEMLDSAYDQLSKMTASRLVSITHWEKGAWAKNYVPGVRGIVIPDADIVAEYKQRITD